MTDHLSLGRITVDVITEQRWRNQQRNRPEHEDDAKPLGSCPGSYITIRVIESQARHSRTIPANPQASSRKSIRAVACAIPSPLMSGGVPKNQAPGTLKAKGEPGSEAATHISIDPSNPAKKARLYGPNQAVLSIGWGFKVAEIVRFDSTLVMARD